MTRVPDATPTQLASPRARPPEITLVTRPWDHLAPLACGEVAPRDFTLNLVSADQTPDPWTQPDLDGGEASFSRYVRACADGDDTVVGLPAFLMRGFRHRCLLVRADSDLTEIHELAGRRVGLTGWPDSGNTWTRAILRRAGVDLAGIDWTVAPLTPAAPGRPQPSLPAHVSQGPAGLSLLDGLLQGRFDAIMAPFIPPHLHAPDAPVRHLLPDYRAAEAAYFAEVGFVPGIHLTVLRADLVAAHPWLPSAVLELLEQSKRLWQARRRFYADTTPWVLADFAHTEAVIGADWMPHGLQANAAMTAAFCAELTAQQIVSRPVDPDGLFTGFGELAGAH